MKRRSHQSASCIASCIAALLICCLSAAPPAGAQEWTRFRGPNGAGVSDAESIPTSWTMEDFNWRIELPGIGHSSPVLWGEKLFITSASEEDARQFVMCYRSTDGKPLWKREFASAHHHHHLRNSFASSTPAVDGKHVYVCWSNPEEYTLLALDHAGNDVWRRDLGPFESQHSSGTSPIVYKDSVILGNDQDGKSFLICVDASTGDTRWQTDRRSRKVAYSTPCVYTPPGGPDELIFNSGAHGISSINPYDGDTNWEIDVFELRSCSSPIIAGGLVYGSCGSGGGGNYVVAVRPGAPDGTQPEVAYKVDFRAPYVPTPVAKDNLVFLWYDQGFVTCINAPTGDVVWRNRVEGGYSGSPVCVRDYIYCIEDNGEAVVLAAAADYKLVARNPLGEASRSTPAVAGGTMFLRTYSHLMSIGGAGPSGP